MSDAPELLLANHLKTLRLPTFLREHDKLAGYHDVFGLLKNMLIYKKLNCRILFSFFVSDTFKHSHCLSSSRTFI